MKNIGGRGYRPFFQLALLGMPKNTSRIYFSFQPLAQCPSRNSFLLITIHFHGGRTPLALLSSRRASQGRRYELYPAPPGNSPPLPSSPLSLQPLLSLRAPFRLCRSGAALPH